MTQHQAPEVTSELAPCPFCGARDGRLLQAFTRATESFAYWSVECLDCSCEIASDTSQEEANAAWNTRATQPLSLTVDDDLIARTSAWLRQCSYWLLTTDLDMECPMRTDPLDLADALDRLQSLSGSNCFQNGNGSPVAGEQIAENANCSGDIDRSGLAQEVEEAEMADLIDRVGVLAAMDKLDSAGEQSEFAAGYDAAVRACIEAVENAPAREGMAAAIRARS